MAVYTHLTHDEIVQHLKQYDLGELVEWKEIKEGIENSNFFIRTTRNRFILTIFEKRVDPNDLPYFIGIMEHLAKKGIACPLPLPTRDGQTITTLKNKPSTIISFLEGTGVKRIRNTHMAYLGGLMGDMHMAIVSYPDKRINTMSLPEWKVLAAKVAPRADEIESKLGTLIEKEITFLEKNWPSGLPEGVIHADLFPDNVFYKEYGPEVALTGVIDFYFACNDFFMYDLAITMNAWCFERSNHHEFNITRTSMLLRGYNHIRTISREELDALPILARGAALRFLLTRCHDWLYPAPDALVKAKDPQEYLTKLKFHQRVKSSTEYGI